MRSKRFMSIAFLVCAAVTVAGCTTDPYTGQRKVSNTAIGAGIGAAGGAATGLAVGAISGKTKSKELRKRALIGAGVGALAGAGVGGYMDYQEAKLRERLQRTGVSVTRVGNDIILNMPGNVTFDSGSSHIKSSFYDVLNSVAIVLKEYDKTYVDVFGHTDSVGSETYNQSLSEQRAGSVASYLISQGLNGNRFSTQGFGESRPLATNGTEEGRALNRRVEIQLTPIT